MFKPNTVLLLGIWLIIVSFLGVPASWRMWLLVATGFALVAAYLKDSGREALRKFYRERKADTFSQNGGSNAKDGAPTGV